MSFVFTCPAHGKQKPGQFCSCWPADQNEINELKDMCDKLAEALSGCKPQWKFSVNHNRNTKILDEYKAKFSPQKAEAVE